MNKEIKERIETINKGKVPDGYIRTKAGLMPCDWIKSKPLTTNMIFENISDKNHGNEYPVLSATQEKGIVLRSEIEKDINFNKENTNSYKLVCKGDYVISLRSFQGGIEYSNIDGLVSPAYTVIRPIIPISDGYYKEYFKTNDFIDRLNSAIYGIRDGKQIGYKDFAELALHNPPLEEQEKIAEILSRCDTVIEECEKQVEEYKNLKKTCLSKMFPKKGSNVPEIRFPGFTDAWEQRKLGSMVIDHNAGIYISKEDYGSGTNVIGVGNIYDNDIFDGEIYRFGPVNDDRFLLEENDLIYGESSLVPEGIARTVCVGKNGVGSAFAWHTRRVKLDQNIVNSHFATLELNYNTSIRKYLMSVSTQTALTGMTTEGYFGVTLMLPSVKEQASISDFFKNLDHLITLHQRKVNAYTQMKKALTQLLLTGIVRVNKQKEILP